MYSPGDSAPSPRDPNTGALVQIYVAAGESYLLKDKRNDPNEQML